MTIQLSDDAIGSLLAEQKVLPEDFLNQPKLKSKHGHKEFEREITGENGSVFRLVFRQSESNQSGFFDNSPVYSERIKPTVPAAKA